MIIEANQIPPYIHFGFNKQKIVVQVNENLTVWQNELYIDTNYTLNCDDGVVTHSDIQKSILSFPTTGIKTINVVIINDKRGTKTSNNITVSVI